MISTREVSRVVLLSTHLQHENCSLTQSQDPRTSPEESSIFLWICNEKGIKTSLHHRIFLPRNEIIIDCAVVLVDHGGTVVTHC
jgi:hypothetical protein